MKKFSLLFVLVFFCSFNPKISVAEPGFFLQTLTNTFVDWVFGRLDTYIEDKPDESDEPLDKKSVQEPNKNTSDKKVSIKMDEVVKRDNTFYKKFSNIPFSGHIESYHPNGQLKIIGEFSEGKKIGKWVEYYESGKLREENYWDKGTMVGEWIQYYESGQISNKQEYKNGKTGRYTSYHLDGRVFFEG